MNTSMGGVCSLAIAAVVLLSAFDADSGGVANAAVVSIPNTPAGNTLKAWLDALNSGDRARMAAYCAKADPNNSADELMAFYKETGGDDLVAVDKSERLHIEFRVKARATPTVGVGKLDVTDGHPARVAKLSLRAIPPGMTAADMNITVDATSRSRILDGIVARLTDYYVYPDTAKKMIDAMRAHQHKGEYDAVTDGDEFARLVGEHLRAVSKDGHLRVECTPETLPKEEREPPPLDSEPPVDDGMREHMLRTNCGFEKVERLEGNIGYLKFNFFGPPSVCGPTASAAMSFLAHVDALIVDLRDNGGGSPRMVAWISSYLFDARTHLNDLYERKRNKTVEFWTRDDVPGPKLGGKAPVYVLTSKRTFSGAEEFTYNLKNLQRATIVGETTGGGAHPTAGFRLDDHFMIGVPSARAVNPITKTDWEGTGVEPDVKASADQALDVAKKLATDAVRKQAQPSSPGPR